MKKKITSILLICLLIFGTVGIGFCDNKNLSREEVEKLIGEIAIKRGIPSVILKSIAKIESSFNQFNRNGKPLTSRGGHIGIMQIGGRETIYNLEKVKKDPLYNIEAGADHLLVKWRMANEKMAQIGNMDPNILEHWYFALWGYNGLTDRNNPNVNNRTYQNRVYEIALKDYGQKITPVSRGSIPSRGWPKRNIKIPTPKDYHEGDILKYSPEDRVKPDLMTKANGINLLVLYDKPNGKEIGKVKENSIMTIIEGPVLSQGFYFYKVKLDEGSKIGWVYGNWISKVKNQE
jgi:hypothetical protein